MSVELSKKLRNIRTRWLELTREREHSDLAIEKLEKEVTNPKRKEDLIKKLAVIEFKAFKQYEEALIEESSTY